MNFRLRYAFLFPGVNSRAELVPSHGASRRWLGDYFKKLIETIVDLAQDITRYDLEFRLFIGLPTMKLVL